MYNDDHATDAVVSTTSSDHGNIGPDDVQVFVEILGEARKPEHLAIPSHETLLFVLDKGAHAFHVELLPNAEEPLDRLYGFHGDESGPHLDLQLMLKEHLDAHPASHRFGIELVLAIRINTRWRIASSCEMTPKAILELADLPWEEYTLYRPGEKTALPLEKPIELHRGECFEAQKDGKYGAGSE